MNDIDADQWQSLLSPQTSPFLDYYWLRACESSGSMIPQTGWQTCHVLGFLSGDDAANYVNPVCALPLYLKNHSWGEFVFDFTWVDFFTRIGKGYYPKAVGVIPATPVTAYEPLMKPEHMHILVQALGFIRETLMSAGVKSLSFLFVTPSFADKLAELGYSCWVHQGFTWCRGNIETFDDYLSTFRKNQRKNIRKERRSFIESGLKLRILRGTDLDDASAHDMYALYSKTNAQFGPWAAKFFNRAFFEEVFCYCSDHIVLLNAEDAHGHVLGRSMLVLKNDVLFGRYWGCHEFIKNLHFNLCYYEPIEFAISMGLYSFDPGMGGEHKSGRGFVSVEQYSMHSFFDEMADTIFAENIEQFNEYSRQQIALLNG